MRRGGYEAPVGATEELLARIWSELLGVERVGRHDNFFELGGHSLLAVTLVSRLRQALNVEVPLAGLFAKPVLSEFACFTASASASSCLRLFLWRGTARCLCPLPSSGCGSWPSSRGRARPITCRAASG